MSENGKLPIGWRLVTLNNLIQDAQSGFATGERDSQGVIQIRMNNVDTRGNLLLDDFIRVPVDSLKIERYCLQKGDVLFNNTNSVELVGKSTIFEGYDEPITFSNHFTRLRVIPEQLNPYFLLAWLVHQWQKKIFENICNRWIGQSAVKSDKLLALKIPLPSLVEEQQRIVELLNQKIAVVDETRLAAVSQLEAALALPMVFLREVFEGDMVKKWAMKHLPDIARQEKYAIKRGPFGSSLRKEFFVSSGYKVYEQQHAIANDFSIGSYYITKEKYLELLAFKLEPKDIIISCSGTIGKIGIAPRDIEPGIINQALLKITLNPDVMLPEYFKLVFESLYVQKQIEDLSMGSGLKNVASVKLLKLIEFPVPSLRQQLEVINEYTHHKEQVEKLIDSLESQLFAIKIIPAAFLRQAFNGEL